MSAFEMTGRLWVCISDHGEWLPRLEQHLHPHPFIATHIKALSYSYRDNRMHISGIPAKMTHALSV